MFRKEFLFTILEKMNFLLKLIMNNIAKYLRCWANTQMFSVQHDMYDLNNESRNDHQLSGYSEQLKDFINDDKE